MFRLEVESRSFFSAFLFFGDVVNEKCTIVFFQAQPRRTLPGRLKFEVTQKPYDPYPNLYHMFNSWLVTACVSIGLQQNSFIGF